MTDHALASFEAKDGTGRWEVFTWGPCAPGATWLAGKRFETGASSSEIARWIGELEKLKQ